MLLSNLWQKHNFRLEETLLNVFLQEKISLKIWRYIYISEGVLNYLIGDIQMYLHFESGFALLF